MKTFLLFILFCLISLASGFSQKLKEIAPSYIGSKISYTPKEEKEWVRIVKIYEDMNNFKLKYENSSLKDKRMFDKIEMFEGPLTLAVADSWYDLGGPYKITASSCLDSTEQTSYKPDNIQDFNLLTAWAVHKPNYGKGEYVEFYFKPFDPRVNKIIVYNGYIKNKFLWENNSRVKKMKLYLNNQQYAILDLEDTSAPQTFKIDPIQSKIKDIDLVIKLEILDVYIGKKSSDVVISEINFNGLDVHCLGRGTKISQPNNQSKNIENLSIGDTVISVEMTSNTFSKSIVEKLDKVNHTNLVKYFFENGNNIITTQDQPFFIDKKSWSSLQPIKSRMYLGYEQINKIEIGDKFEIDNGNNDIAFTKLIKIEFLKGKQETYTILKLNTRNNFIANGFIVGTEELKN